MEELTNKELNNIIGGSIISATLINSVVRGAELLLELGRSFGTSVRRFFSKNYC